jgi:hypothetical protein
VANRNYPEIKLAGLTVGPFEEGNEYEVYFWIAKELSNLEMVHFREEDILGFRNLFRQQFLGGILIPEQISSLPEDFYPKLRRFIADLKDQASKQLESEKFQEYNRAKQLARDIVNSRMKKIVALSSAPSQTDYVLKKLTSEEKLFYEQLVKIISEWKARILENGEKPT